MLFNSFDFVIFLPIVLIVYYALPSRFRWIFLLLASYIFYAGWKVAYLGLIIFSTVIDFFASNRIHRTDDVRKRKRILAFSLCSNFSILILFKYFHFLIGGSTWFTELSAKNENILWLQFVFEYGIPVGISFYTFQTVSYTIDVYRRRIFPEANIGKFALYVSFFPQLVAGPIERFSNLHPQLFRTNQPKWEYFRSGLQLLLVGFFFKMTVADNIGTFIAPIFDFPEAYSLLYRWLSVILFGIQIYSDFFGYSLIAIGCARMFAVQLMNNFQFPYGAYSLKEFWSRWHISLSTWFRDYVYIPLGGSKSSKFRWFIAIFITFFLSGLWHGADVRFIYWGVLHGLYLWVEQTFFPLSKNRILPFWEKLIRWSVTMTVIGFGWLLFRIDRLRNVKLFFQSEDPSDPMPLIGYELILPLVCFFLVELLIRKKRPDTFFSEKKVVVRWIGYILLIAMLLLCSSTGDLPFIYFQF
jgi:alginate O-acetyltransferase complex protein AlgI